MLHLSLSSLSILCLSLSAHVSYNTLLPFLFLFSADEVTALKRLAARSTLQQEQEHGASGGFSANYERVVDDWLRKGVFVDLYPLVRRCLLVGEPKYSIKNFEKLYGDWDDEAPLPQEDTKRLGDPQQQQSEEGDQVGGEPQRVMSLRSGAAVAKGDDSVVAYQRWLERPDAPGAGAGSAQLEAIRAYNQDDTDSTHRAVKWLRAVAASAGRAYGFKDGGAAEADGNEGDEGEPDAEEEAARAEKEAEECEAKAAEEGELDELIATLLDDDDPRWHSFASSSSSSSSSLSSSSSSSSTPVVVSRRAREVAAAALEFERREAKPGWWRRFAWLDATDRELLADEGVLGGLTHDPSFEPSKRTPRKKKLCYVYRFDPAKAAGSKLAQAVAAALEEKKAAGAGEDPRAANVLALPSEQDCSPLDVTTDGESSSSSTSNGLYERDSPLRAAVVELDLQRGVAVVEMGLPLARDDGKGGSIVSEPPPPRGLSLLPDEFVNPEPIPGAVKRTVKEWVADPAAAATSDPIFALLAGTPPLLSFKGGEEDGAARSGGIIDRATQHLARATGGGEVGVLDAAAAAAAALERSSYLAIQGPPGTGKTSAAALIIADAVGRGQRVAVTANSHKVITNLLAKATEVLAGRAARGELDDCAALQERLRACSSEDDVDGDGGSGSGMSGGGGGGGVVRPIGVVKIGSSSAAAFTEDIQSIEAAGERGSGVGEALSSLLEVRGSKSAKGAALEPNDLLIGATAWGLANEALEGCADYLVVDEAGQVPVTRLLAMKRVLGGSEEEAEQQQQQQDAEGRGGGLILLGDQMQLPAPTEGTHPGQSGKSILEYLLLCSSSSSTTTTSSGSTSTSGSASGGGAVVPPDMGIFLPVSYRLHPELCDVVSALVYDGELRAHPSNARRTLQLLDNSDDNKGKSAGRLLDRGAGLVVVPVAHSGNTQASSEEAAAVVDIVRELLDPSRTRLAGGGGDGDNGDGDESGLGRALTMDDILFVSPFNLQVQRLSAALRNAAETIPSRKVAKHVSAGTGAARVGTVDRFQGQEAPVVIVSLARSSFGQADDGAATAEDGNDNEGNGVDNGGGDLEGDLDEAAAASGEAWREQAAGSFLDVDVMDEAAGGGTTMGGGAAEAAAAAAEQSSSSSSSSGAVSFVLDVRRLNVALSRAQCLAIVVMSPQLSAASAASLEQMRALSFACRLLEGNGDGVE